MCPEWRQGRQGEEQRTQFHIEFGIRDSIAGPVRAAIREVGGGCSSDKARIVSITERADEGAGNGPGASIV